MPALIFRRDGDAKADDTQEIEKPSTSGTMTGLLITLIVLVVFGIVLGGSLYFIRRIRQQRKDAGTLPSYEAAIRDANCPHSHNRLTIQTDRNSTFIYSEKQGLVDNGAPMPQSPDNVPEIRITFPDEEKDGRRVSGRVMVVSVGEAGVGFVKPLENEGPPSYQQEEQRNMQSVDLDRYGGLKEVQ